MYFCRLLVLLSVSRVRGQQSGDIVWYIDCTSIADPETCGHEASQLYSSLEVVFHREPTRSFRRVLNFMFEFSLRYKY